METESQNTPVKAQPRKPARKRDQRTRRLVRVIERLSPTLSDPRYRPALQTAARLTLLVEATYQAIKDRGLINEDGSLYGGLDVFRRLADSQLSALKSLGLSPSSILPQNPGERSFDAVYERIERVRKTRADGDANKPA
jgi:hypothetical protein